ncbi:MAG: DUF2203 domain-containing protein [Bacteroidota bacterium]
MHLHKKHFTLEEARAHVPTVEHLVAQLVELKRSLDKKGYDVYRHTYFGGMGLNGQKDYPPELVELVQIVRALDEKGILVKGLDEGLIDFPSIRENGEEVYLCWKLGEHTIDYWHRIPDGYRGRKPIGEL